MDQVDLFVERTKKARLNIFIKSFLNFNPVSWQEATRMAGVLATLSIIDPNKNGVQEDKLFDYTKEYFSLTLNKF